MISKCHPSDTASRRGVGRLDCNDVSLRLLVGAPELPIREVVEVVCPLELLHEACQLRELRLLQRLVLFSARAARTQGGGTRTPGLRKMCAAEGVGHALAPQDADRLALQLGI
eukprot:CAMPEP_0195656112 /NCGR_PEP_ID=MMETSP0815-20121206/34823_1 /TAXON_ID=97485 /ORGANISM="Prymnesium parvum, Strain Texoma1" /LENGTH=112 /DNA_ID=CAMNT_0040800455 /DNA_START=671 /DNA_END=1007 /DNA_ORIENTATION=-